MDFQISLEVSFQNDKELSVFWNSMKPELLGTTKGKRSTIEASRTSNKILFNLHARDSTALRASINSILQLFKVIEDTLEITNSVDS